MKRGVRFKIPNDYGKILADILQPINYVEYKWKVDNDQIWMHRDGKLEDTSLFKNKLIDGQEFKSVISQNTYYVIFAVIKAFSKDMPITNISKYEDFVNSACEIIILIVDSVYVDVYCKDVMLVEKIYNNVQLKNFEEIEYINENDSRTKMDI